MIKKSIRLTFKTIAAFASQKNILLCPDKFKFSLTSSQISRIFQQLLPKHCQSQSIVLADGGQGSLQTISQKTNGKWNKCKVLDPLFRSIQAQYFVGQNNQSYIQMARASGLQLLDKQQRNPLFTTTFGTGQLILDSLNQGYTEINLLIGGSATNDAGIGMANALGYDFQDEDGQKLVPIGQNLIKIKDIKHRSSQLKKKIEKATIKVYTDVKNTLTGENGATRVYGPQKGATPQIVDQLQQGMENFRQICIKKYGKDMSKLAGSGAAGGLGGGCSIFLNAQLHRGIDLIFQLTNFEQMAKKCDLIITGEGRVDRQTLEGKVVKGVIDRATKYKKKILVICAFCQNPDDFNQMKNVELVQLLKEEQRSVIDPKLTKSRLQNFVKQYAW